jgi:hypothetical protein
VRAVCGLTSAFLLGASASAHAANDDAAIYARIDALRAAAQDIKIDGRAEEWSAFLRGEDAAGDGTASAVFDITGLAIAPMADGLFVMLDTGGPISPRNDAYWLDVDVGGSFGSDFRVSLSMGGDAIAWRFNGERAMTPLSIDGMKFARGEVYEAWIPYAGLPADLRSEATKKDARPWVRVSAASWSFVTKDWVDRGPSVASYRLVDTPYPLDAPLPATGRAVAVGLPLDGKWLVGQAAFTTGSHHGIWAYDFYPVDDALDPMPIGEDARNEAYYGWDKPVILRDPGKVQLATADARDNPPRQDNTGLRANEVRLDLGSGVGMRLLHFRQATVAVRPGEVVATGAEVGRVGNSGYSWWPHLHLELHRPLTGKTVPGALRNIRVGLNPAEADPWARDLSVWAVREGMFVENLRQ